jgi:mannose-6-phosphate isomerase-like protein (cupin superfamily)
MRKFILFVAAAGMALGADPSGFVIWKSTELKGFEKKLAPKVDPTNKVATLNLDKFDNHLTMVAHREASGQAELHENQADLFVVESGAATLIVGGKVVDGKTTGPGEIRGPSIEGGSKHAVGAGDIVHIPAKIPHQLTLDAGKQVTYFVLKVDTK